MFVLSSIRLYSLYGSHTGTTSERSLYPEIRTKETQLNIYCTIGYYRGSVDSWCYCETNVCEVRSQLDYIHLLSGLVFLSLFLTLLTPSHLPPHKHTHTHTLIINSICGIKATFYQVSYFSHYSSLSPHTFTPTPPHTR